MESMVHELKKIMPFKESTAPGDVVLVAIENSKAVFYALVVDIVRDATRRDEWWNVTLQILSVPPQLVVWTLRESQFTGQETFTMAGDGRFMKAVDFSKAKPSPEQPPTGKKIAKGRPALKLVK